MSPRRLLPVALALAAVLALGGGALAVAQSGGGGDDPTPPPDRREVRHAALDRVSERLAGELGLPAAQVREGLRDFARERGRALRDRYDTRAERREALRELRRDPAAARALRDELAAGLGEELGVSGERVTRAARSLLAERLDDLVQDGWLSPVERQAALACFDDPGTCAGGARRLGRLLGP